MPNHYEKSTQKVERMFSKDVRTLKMIPLIIRIFSFYNNQLHFSDSKSLRVIPKVCSSAGLMPSSCRFLVCSALVVGVCIRKQGVGDRELSSKRLSYSFLEKAHAEHQGTWTAFNIFAVYSTFVEYICTFWTWNMIEVFNFKTN